MIATDLLIMRLKDDLREGRDLDARIPMLIARIDADRQELVEAKARNTALAEQFEREATDLMTDRDDNAEMADRLAAAISAITGVEIGEHSSMNDPWRNALAAAEASR